jgi:hypothetical protein
MATHGGLAYKKMRTLQRELERVVLSYLRDLDEPIHSQKLQAHFDLHLSSDIAPVLQDLKAGCYISVDAANMVTIKEVGLSRLRAGMF